MKCAICGENANEISEQRTARYRGETVEVVQKFFRCESCKEEFVTPEQMRVHSRAVKNEIRKKYGLLPPERIIEIRKKLELTQSDLEELLGTGPKVVVRWESGKVIQSGGHDNMLRLLERDPSILKSLRQIRELRSAEQKQYQKAEARKPQSEAAYYAAG
ncbi:MAG TPA: type II toxin-antitoxin system MqsA family antitoxin [Terriglobales bacterium]|nr:type II toxin-antitoxin system MqsA family antitoxin [Terriglobales bacterium]